MKNRHKIHKNVGGATLIAGNPKVVAAAKSKSDGFKTGGKVPAGKSMKRLDKRARGGRTGSPFSSAYCK